MKSTSSSLIFLNILSAISGVILSVMGSPPVPGHSAISVAKLSFLILTLSGPAFSYDLMNNYSNSAELYHNVHIPLLDYAVINCNSLNASTSTSNHFKLKLYGIAKLKKDIILLSDIRLGSNPGSVSAIKNTFLINPYCGYDFYYNSSTSSRGVGILIKHSLNITARCVGQDSEENILALRITSAGKSSLVISIYGPNKPCKHFFDNLDKILTNNKNTPCIMGGDWNCSFSNNSVTENIDLLNMSSLSNSQHSKK